MEYKYLTTRQVNSTLALEAYAQYIKEHVDPIAYHGINNAKILEIMGMAIDNLEQARIFKKFEGK
jgi:hypothetical protein